jgi:hypothetical protein
MTALTLYSRGVKSVNSRRLLVSVAVLPLALGGMAAAAKAADGITVTAGTVTANAPGMRQWAIPVGGTTTATVVTSPLNGGVGLNGIWILQAGTGGTDNVNLSNTVAGNSAVVVTSYDDIININNGVSVNGLVLDGVYNVNVTGGVTNINGAGTFNGARNGIWTTTPGNVNIGTAGGPVGAITGGSNGLVVTESIGTTIANLTSAKGTAGYGIWTVSSTGDQTFTATGAVSGTTGQYLNSGTGNISTDGKGSGTLTGTVLDGALVSTLGNATVNNYATVEGLRNGIWVAGTGVGTTTNVQGNGLVGGVTGTALNGIVVGATLGATNIGTTATNGVIQGGVNGIWVNGTVGNTAIVTDKNVTGTAGDGIISGTTTGSNSVTSNGGTIKGALWGILDLSGTGNVAVDLNNTTVLGNAAVEASTAGAGTVTTDIDAASQLIGNTWGYVTTTGTGAGVTNNAGLIKTTNDNGLTGDTGLVATVWVKAGTNNTINNLASGKIYGGITDGGLNTVLNNAGIWDAALANAMNATSTINNTGTINIRTGSTVGVGVTNNLAGGLVDLTYGGTSPNATDTLYTYGYNALAGSMTNFNVDFTLANGSGVGDTGDDHSSTGLGTADTIRSVANPTPAAAATINLVNVGGPVIGTSGSIALILPDANIAGMVDPGLGGLATLIPSANYIYGSGNPSTGAVKVVLQEDAFGGLYLRWAPNITAASLGGFLGGPLGGGTSGGGAVSGGAGGLAGMGASLSGGPGGGGVAGGIADSASSAAGNSQNCVVAKDAMDGTYSNANHAWLSGTGSTSSFDGGATGWDAGAAVGLEHDLGGAAGIGCGNLAVGIFGNFGSFGTDSATSAIDGTAKGGGIYAKASSQSGLYASVMLGGNWSDANMTNAVFGSTAKQSSFGKLATASVGYATKLTETLGMDARVFGTIAHNEGDGFTDSAGITVDYTKADITAFGVLTGLNANLSGNTTAFVRGGLKWMTVDQEASAFGIVVSGQAKAFVKSVEAGFESQVGDGATLSGSAFGDFTKDSTSYGGNVSLVFKF